MMKYPGLVISLTLLCLLSCSGNREGDPNLREAWMSVWIGDQKIGWIYTLERPRDEGYEITERTKLELSVMGQAKSIETLTQSENSKEYEVRAFLFEVLSEEHSYRVEGEVSGAQLNVEVLTGGEKKTEIVHVPDGAYLPFSIGRVAVLKRWKPGDVTRLPVYDPSALSLLDATVEVGGVEELTLPDYQGDATELSVEMWNVRSTLWIDQSGWLVKELAPMGIEMRKTTRENAMKQEPVEMLLEILTHYSVPSEVTIPNPREVKWMVVELTGAEQLPEIEDERQFIVSTNPLRLRISVQPQEPGEYSPEDLGSTALIQSDNELIRQKALSIVEGAASNSAKVERLVQWLYQNISKTPTVSFPSALDVLRSQEGDCNEHAVLFAALARSLGIPTRICVGVVYQAESFYYHAWNKVWTDGWTACDPTFGQFVADATHLKFLEGDLSEQIKVTSIIGNLHIDVIEHSTALD